MNLLNFHDNHHRMQFGLGPMNWTKNKPLSWYPADTEERFDLHWSKSNTRKILIEHNWTKENITYKSNDFGFRMNKNINEIKIGECDFYLGCSHTFGIGLNLEDTWGWKLSQKKGLEFINLGWPAGSIEAQYRLLRCWAEKLRPKRAFTLGAYLSRREILRHDGSAECIGPWFKNGPMYTVYERLSNDNEITISMLRTLDAMKSVCFQNNIELYTIADDMRNEIFSETDNNTARDLIHFGCNWHSRIANIPDSSWKRLA